MNLQPVRRVFYALGVALAAASIAGAEPARIAGIVHTYVVAAGDTWASIGARVGLDPQTLIDENGGAARAPRAGQVLRIDNRHIVPAALTAGAIVINLPQRMLFFDAQGEVHAFPVAVGRSTWRTPMQPFRILTKERDPSWEVPASIREEARRAGKSLPAVVPPGPTNPLGKFWLGLSIPNVGIHGTNAPSSIYRAATHGCIRLHPDDIATLFDLVDIGTPGRIVYEPLLVTAVGDEVFVEAHPDVYRLAGDPQQQVRSVAETLGVADRIDWSAVGRVLKRRAGVARPVTGHPDYPGAGGKQSALGGAGAGDLPINKAWTAGTPGTCVALTEENGVPDRR